MKRTAMQHTKLKRLVRALKVPQYAAVGILESLWHLTAREAPEGNIGKLSNEDIAAWMDWQGESDELISALVTAGWLDESEATRLEVHDWMEHADDTTKKALARQKAAVSGNVQTFPDKQGTSLDKEPLPEPLPEPVPVKKEQKTSRDKREVDQRHVSFRLAIETYMTYKGATFVWDASEAKTLNLLLKSCPDLTLALLQTCLNHRARSPGTAHGERPRVWLANITKYQLEPLNEYGKTGAPNGNRNSKTGGNLDAAAQAIRFLEQEDRNRQAADESFTSETGSCEPGDFGAVCIGSGEILPPGH
jgi:hypothetical protein